MTNEYTLLLQKNNSKLLIPLKAFDTNHAQAQAKDILRAINTTEFNLIYEKAKSTRLSILFKKLAFNDFCNSECFEWDGTRTNKCPCVYIFSSRLYIKDVILRYLDIPKERSYAKNRCNNTRCINPYHFEYHTTKNSKLTCGDTKLLLAYRGQGTGVNQIAEALNVHRSTIYRKLKNERLSSGSANHSRS